MDDIPELHRNPEAAAEMAANAVVNYLRQCEIAEQNDRLQWIAKVFDAVKAREGRTELAN